MYQEQRKRSVSMCQQQRNRRVCMYQEQRKRRVCMNQEQRKRRVCMYQEQRKRRVCGADNDEIIHEQVPRLKIEEGCERQLKLKLAGKKTACTKFLHQ